MTKRAPMTPLPDCLIDDLMPFLKDTEFRVLCIVARHTLGWRDQRTGEHKDWDWISHHQFRHQTGRSSAAVSRAIDRLCQLDLIDVAAKDGQPLSTSRIRRQHRGRLHFRLNPLLLEDRIPEAFSKRRLPKVKTTTRHSDNNVVVPQKDDEEKFLESKDQRSERVQGEWRRVGELLKSGQLGEQWRRRR